MAAETGQGDDSKNQEKETKLDVEAVLAPFNPTPDVAIACALDILKYTGGGDGGGSGGGGGENRRQRRHARHTTEEVLYELGCGDARFLCAAAKAWKELGSEVAFRGVGVEYDGKFADRARSRIKEECLSDVLQVVHADACTIEFQEQGATTLFLCKCLIPE